MMRKSFLLLLPLSFCLLFNSFVFSQDKRMNPSGMKTRWADEVTPQNVWNNYPRPQLKRNEWLNLNGLWEYAIVKKNAAKPRKFQGNILVPFCAESALSGVQQMVMPDQQLWYKRYFELPENWEGKSIKLRFEAVDWETRVWVNGKLAGSHQGGSDPFSFDITPLLKKGKQELVVSVWDPTDTEAQPRGKQVLNPTGIWYTPVTGIWQTVWLEPVEKTHISSVLPVADIDLSEMILYQTVAGLTGTETIEAEVWENGRRISQQSGKAGMPLKFSIPNARLWDPGSPFLYQLKIRLQNESGKIDEVTSYFAMRKIAKGKDFAGYERLMLNNKPVFQYGTLDQGWWPDGLLTPPSAAAMIYDMQVLKDMGFNMLRKHIKVEPALYYYYADSLGLLVWQDMVSGFVTAQREVQHVKWDAEKDWDRPKASAVQYEKEWKSIMDHLRFFPSIVVWVPFNEGWGQYDSKRVVEWTQRYDSTRVIDGISGWTDRNIGDMYDVHQYPGPAMELPEVHSNRIMVLGEFGGLGWPVEGHIWNPEMRNWGYRTYTSQQELLDEYSLLIKNLVPMVHRGLSAGVYTQTTDVEGEVNGLLTYDRKRIKIQPGKLRELHQPLYQKTYPVRVLIEDSRLKGVQAIKRDSMKYEMVKNFDLTMIPEKLQLTISAHGEVKIYINNQLTIEKFVLTRRHFDEINLTDYIKNLKTGTNEIRVELNAVQGNIPFDFGLYAY